MVVRRKGHRCQRVNTAHCGMHFLQERRDRRQRLLYSVERVSRHAGLHRTGTAGLCACWAMEVIASVTNLNIKIARWRSR